MPPDIPREREHAFLSAKIFYCLWFRREWLMSGIVEIDEYSANLNVVKGRGHGGCPLFVISSRFVTTIALGLSAVQ